MKGRMFDRRWFLRTTLSAAAVGPWTASSGTPNTQGWRTFEITTSVQVLQSGSPTRIWAPLPLRQATYFQRSLGDSVQAPGGKATLHGGVEDSPRLVFAEFPSDKPAVLTVVSRVATRDWTVDFTNPRPVSRLSAGERERFLRGTRSVPVDGIVRERAAAITRACRDDQEKTSAIYDWVVENTHREPAVRGCGVGDIGSMLKSGNLGGKCADLNTLFVALARASGLPARDLYGIRVAPSRRGFKSLGAPSEKVTKAQHCRAEVYLEKFGWIPVDPADVRKVILEEPPGSRALNDPLVQKARAQLFGSWEMNWVVYNGEQEVRLPGSRLSPLRFLMYPQAEISDGRLDCLDPDSFRYSITAREIENAAVLSHLRFAVPHQSLGSEHRPRD